VDVPEFDVNGVYSSTAIEDFDQTFQLVRSLDGEAVRTNATLAFARSVLAYQTPKAH
jgi:hypothetical protein